MTAPDIRVRPATEADGGEVRELLRGSFAENPKARPDIFAWQYWDNPFGAPCSWVADADGRVVAHYAGIRLPGTLRGRPAVLAMGVDAATHPEFRGLGLFEQLARAVYADSGATGSAVTYCLPNPNSLRGFQKAGGQDLGRARVLVAPLDAGWLAGRFKIPPFLAGAARFPFRLGSGSGSGMVGEPPSGLEELWSGLAGAHGNGVARGPSWWRWRYVQRPEAPYVFAECRRGGSGGAGGAGGGAGGRLVGAAVALCRQDLGGTFLCVLELLAEDAAAARSLIGRLAETAAGPLGAVGLATMAFPGTPIYRWARQAGMLPLPRRFEPQPMHVGLVDNMAALPGLAQESWSLAWGDLDHI